MRLRVLAVLWVCRLVAADDDGIAFLGPFPYLTGGAFSSNASASFPDPLSLYFWSAENDVNMLAYQLFYDTASNVTVTDEESFVGAATLVQPECAATLPFEDVEATCSNFAHLEISGSGTLQLRFAQEGAAWIEFDSCDLAEDMSNNWQVAMRISESRLPNELGSFGVTLHNDSCTFRLETTSELYDGLRYAWLDVTKANGSDAASFTITALRRVNQAVPANYEGSFTCSDPDLSKLWRVGAYTTRVAFTCPSDAGVCYLGSILKSRGDRIAVGYYYSSLTFLLKPQHPDRSLAVVTLRAVQRGCPRRASHGPGRV